MLNLETKLISRKTINWIEEKTKQVNTKNDLIDTIIAKYPVGVIPTPLMSKEDINWILKILPFIPRKKYTPSSMKIGELSHRIFSFIKAKFSSIAALRFKILTKIKDKNTWIKIRVSYWMEYIITQMKQKMYKYGEVLLLTAKPLMNTYHAAIIYYLRLF